MIANNNISHSLFSAEAVVPRPTDSPPPESDTAGRSYLDRQEGGGGGLQGIAGAASAGCSQCLSVSSRGQCTTHLHRHECVPV